MNRKKVLIPIIIFTCLIIFLIITLNPSTRYKSLSINESKWNSIKDSRTENENLALEDIEFNGYKLIIDKNNNTLYYSVVKTSKNKYNPNVSYNTRNKNVKLAILSEEITDEKVKNDYKFKIMIYDDKNYHIYDLICTDLPILNIKYKEDVGDKPKNIPVEIFVFNNFANTPNKITMSSGKLKINEDFYTFSLNTITPGKNIRDNKISILNMKPNSEYILTQVTNAEDNNKPKNHRVVLFLNNEYKGVYLLGYVEREKHE